MESTPLATGLTPPLKLAWQNSTSLKVAAAGNGKLYGITGEGSLVAINGATGELVWAGKERYLSGHLYLNGSTLYAYVDGKGLFRVEDRGTNSAEQLMLSFGATTSTNLCNPSTDGTYVYTAVNRSLFALNQGGVMQAATNLPELDPYAVQAVAPQEFLVINGRGVPSRWRLTNGAFQRLWEGAVADPDAGRLPWPYLIAGSKLVIAAGQVVAAYNLSNGQLAWTYSAPALHLTVAGDTVYAAGFGVQLHAINLNTGAPLWIRQYQYNRALVADCRILAAEGALFVGVKTQGHPDSHQLYAFDPATGACTWLARGVRLAAVAGFPASLAGTLIAYGGSATAAYQPLATAPRVQPSMIQISPRPLRGKAASFGAGSIQVDLPVGARVSMAHYREAQGLATPLVTDANWAAGPHTVSWSPSGTGGYTDTPQMGFLLIDIAETGGPSYTHALLMPVNVLPDIFKHWAFDNIITMLYNKLVNGYPDQTFKPDNLLTRAESCTIIAATLGLTGPSAGFKTKFTDLEGHWARGVILALEERGIVGGFAESDGTFTFRPNLSMTRAQEARILFVAYAIAPAPAGFQSKFTDVSGHWAKNEILALENAGYINGFAESNGTFTFRPEQNLTRAELCAIVVRIRALTR